MMSLLSHSHPPGSHIRKSELPIDTLFLDRWSPRAFHAEPLDEQALLTAFEAARWAPSSLNYQPWRFIYARRDSESFERFLVLLAERNREWAHKAGALVAFISDTQIAYKDQLMPSPNHAFDTGAAWANFAHQLHLLGYAARAIGGFNRKDAPDVLGLPERYHVHAFVAVGRPAAPGSLPESFRAKEAPTGRRPLEELVYEGRFAEQP
jgi:nitroreductase